MKVCVYCDSRCEDDATQCPSCGGNTFAPICHNCGTRFEGLLCPKCNTKAGDAGQPCPVCGTITFNNYCPVCEQRHKQELAVIKTRGDVLRKAAESSPLSVVSLALLVVGTMVLPFFSGWYIMFSKKTRIGIRAFFICWSLLWAFSSEPSTEIDLVSHLFLTYSPLAPIVAYGVKLLWDFIAGKKKSKTADTEA